MTGVLPDAHATTTDEASSPVSSTAPLRDSGDELGWPTLRSVDVSRETSSELGWPA